MKKTIDLVEIGILEKPNFLRPICRGKGRVIVGRVIVIVTRIEL